MRYVKLAGLALLILIGWVIVLIGLPFLDVEVPWKDVVLGRWNSYQIERECPLVERQRFQDEATAALEEFQDSYQLAMSTSRIALSPVVQKMQEINRKIKTLSPTPCGEYARSRLIEGTDSVIQGILAFMQEEEVLTQGYLIVGDAILEAAAKELELVITSPSLVPPEQRDPPVTPIGR